MRIAITTTDGKKVDQHFGKATRFDVYDVEGTEMKLVETRDVTSYSETVSGEPADTTHNFSPERFSIVKEKIQDCDKLYTLQIGDKPREQLEIVGIEVHLCKCKVENISTCEGKCK